MKKLRPIPKASEPLRLKPSDLDTLEKALHRRTLLQATVSRQVKGGFIVEVANAKGFLPSSLLDVRLVRDAKQYVGKTLSVNVFRLSPEDGVLIVNRRSVIEQQMGEDRSKLLASLKVGARIDGVVCALTNFGAFVDVGGLQGLIPLSAWSKKPGVHASQFVSPGQMVKVVITALNKDLGRLRITLGTPSVGANDFK